VLQIGVNAKNPLVVGSILSVDTFMGMFMPAYLILEAGKVGTFSMRDREETETVIKPGGSRVVANASEIV
jgi:hypothetical protein